MKLRQWKKELKLRLTRRETQSNSVLLVSFPTQLSVISDFLACRTFCTKASHHHTTYIF